MLLFKFDDLAASDTSTFKTSFLETSAEAVVCLSQLHNAEKSVQ